MSVGYGLALTTVDTECSPSKESMCTPIVSRTCLVKGKFQKATRLTMFGQKAVDPLSVATLLISKPYLSKSMFNALPTRKLTALMTTNITKRTLTGNQGKMDLLEECVVYADVNNNGNDDDEAVKPYGEIL